MAELAISVRAARLDEGPALTELAVRAKSHWGYEQPFLDSARADLAVDPEAIASGQVYVLEQDRRTIGFYGILGQPPQGRLEWMFLEPEVIGSGHGRLMWNHAIDYATQAGFSELLIESDRYAEPFYLAMGAAKIGATPSPVDGVPLPLLKIEIGREDESGAG